MMNNVLDYYILNSKKYMSIKGWCGTYWMSEYNKLKENGNLAVIRDYYFLRKQLSSIQLDILDRYFEYDDTYVTAVMRVEEFHKNIILR